MALELRGPSMAALSASFAARPALVDELVEPFVIAHRGGAIRYPEHTMLAYRAAAQSGFPVEPDLYALADGNIICHHDGTIDRATNGTGNVYDKTLAQWRALTVDLLGPTRPRGAEWSHVLDEFGGRTLLVPEIKRAADATAAIQSVTERGLHRSVLMQSFDYSTAVACAAAGIATCYVTDSAGTGGSNPTFAAIAAAGIEFLGCGTAVADSYIAAAVAAGLRVLVYTVNQQSVAAAKYTAGASGVFSDNPWHVAGNVDPKLDSDPWGDGGLWGVTSGATFRPGRLGEIGMGTPGVAGLSGGLLHTWAGTRGPYVRVRWRVRYDRTSTSDLSRWAGSMFVGKNADADTPYTDTALAGQGEGYHAFIRRNGDMGLYRVASGGTGAAIATDTTSVPDIAAVNSEGYADLELVIDATSVTFKNLTTGTTITAADTTHRRTDWQLSSRWNSNVAYISNVRVEDLAA